MKERPILFSAPMIRALLAGAKTQTRRVVKGIALEWLAPGMFSPEYVAAPKNHLCPYGVPGDRLWVRETWARDDEDGALFYRADVGTGNEADDWQHNINIGASGYGWRPSIHMPRAASRITLEIAAVRIERLQDISEADAIAEGIKTPVYPVDDEHPAERTYRHGFEALWDHINGPGSWDANPWVWVLTFRRLP